MACLDRIRKAFAVGVGFAGADLDQALVIDVIGREMPAVDAARVDSDGEGVLEHVGPRGMAVDHELRAGPAVGPAGSVGCIRAFGRPAFLVDHLDRCRQLDGLGRPGLIRQKSAVNADEFAHAVVFEFRHFLEKCPVFFGQLIERRVVVVLEQIGAAFPAGSKQAELVVAEDRFNLIHARQFNDLMALWAAIDQVSELDDAVVRPKLQRFQQFLEFKGASVHVADGDGSTHSERIWLGSRGFGEEAFHGGTGRKNKHSMLVDFGRLVKHALNHMDWQIKTIAKKSTLSERAFTPGDRVACLNLVDPETSELGRADLLETELAEFTPPAEVLGRWVRVVKEPGEESAQAKETVASAEDFFMSLYENEAPESRESSDALKHLLALMLERKRVLRAVPPRRTEGEQSYLHVKRKETFSVPIVDISPDLMLKIEDTLGELIH